MRMRSGLAGLLIALLAGLACADQASGPPRVIDLATVPLAAGAPSLADPSTGQPVDGTPTPGDDDDSKNGTAADGDGAAEGIPSKVRVRGGDLSPDAVEQGMGRASEALVRCVDAARRKNPDLQGTLVLAFKVKPTGKVAWAKATEASTVQDAAVQRCVLAQVKRLRFARFKGGAAFVTYPFVVTP
ncbi:MAG: AgmX/PglI C-terminal domain-containing protein [Pseudomonadota bacterium]